MPATDDTAICPASFDGELEIKRLTARLRALIEEAFVTWPPPSDYVESEQFKEITTLSARLVAMGATECESPDGVGTAALFLDRTAKLLDREAKRVARAKRNMADVGELIRQLQAGELKWDEAVQAQLEGCLSKPEDELELAEVLKEKRAILSSLPRGRNTANADSGL